MYSSARTAWKVFLSLNVGLIIFFWIQGSRDLISSGAPGVLIMAGRLMGLIGGFMILLQFFFMGRLPFLERIFGLDTLSRYHQKNGKWGMALIILHAFCLTLGYARLSSVSFLVQFENFLLTYSYGAWAFLGFTLLCVVVGTSLYIVRSKLKYETWYLVHLAAYLAVFFSYFHQFSLGTDLIASRIFYGYWTALYVIVFGTHLLFRILRPLYLFRKHRFFVSRVVRETPTTVSVHISGDHLDAFLIHPGQFMILRFLAKGFWWQGHPFSLSMIPDGKEIRVTIKELGDFTRSVHGLKPGTKVIIDGPYGIFTDRVLRKDKALMIAGGIGITPIRSLMEKLVSGGKEVVLFYANRTSLDIPLREELNLVAQNPKARVIHVLGDEPQYAGERGRVDEEKIRRLVPDFKDREIYICGPVPMMDGLVITLLSMGVSKENLHYEKFAF